MATIEIRNEAKRGCGYRKPGGLYMVTEGVSVAVPCLPVPLHVCPVCYQGVKATRSFQWIEPGRLLLDLVEKNTPACPQCMGLTQVCAMASTLKGKAGLMWIGDKYYTPESFRKEAAQMGISKRIPNVPKDFKIGEHWVFLGHRKAIVQHVGHVGSQELKDEYKPGIFTAFKPTAIEYVVKPDDSVEKLDSLAKRGITLVDVKPIKEPELDL